MGQVSFLEKELLKKKNGFACFAKDGCLMVNRLLDLFITTVVIFKNIPADQFY